MLKIKIACICLLLIFSAGCKRSHVPRPRGYFRIDLPEKKYTGFNLDCSYPLLPVTFEYPVYGKIVTTDPVETGWFNIEFPSLRARLYLTYRKINRDLPVIMEQTYRMNVKNHISKADAINEKAFTNNERHVYGILYDLKGNTATAVQFYATDSTKNYLRGSLYFSAEPNADSLEPVIDFFRQDIVHLIETLNWKK